MRTTLLLEKSDIPLNTEPGGRKNIDLGCCYCTDRKRKCTATRTVAVGEIAAEGGATVAVLISRCCSRSSRQLVLCGSPAPFFGKIHNYI